MKIDLNIDVLTVYELADMIEVLENQIKQKMSIAQLDDDYNTYRYFVDHPNKVLRNIYKDICEENEDETK